MARSTYSAPVSEVYGQSTALATTLAYGDVLNVRKGFKGLQLYCASAFKFLTTPRIGAVYVYDESAKKYYDYTSEATDNNASNHVCLGSMVVTDICYVGCVAPFLGLSINVDSANAVNTALDVEYYKNAWTDVADDLDGTDSTGTLAVDGLYTWTLPTDWTPTSVNGGPQLYFIRFKPDASLTAGVTFDGLCAINKGTSYAYFPAGMTEELNYDDDLVGGVQFLAAAGTPTVYVNWIKYKG